jgi:uncharacterized protein YjgD (DUF1641 family)
MARPIPLSAPIRDPHSELMSRLQNAPSHHAEALLGAYDVLQGLYDCGALELLRGMLGSRDKVLEVAVHAANSPESIRGLRNLILLSKALGEIDPQQLGNFTRAVPEALNSAAAGSKPPGLWALVTAVFWNGNVRRGLWAAIMFLEACGRNISKRPPQ